MARSVVAACLLFAGVWLLAGLGWALVAGGFLVFALWRREPDWAVLAAWVKAAAARLARRVTSAPRRATAVSGMTAGVALLPAGLGLSAGAGVAVAAGGVLLIGVGLLTGWGA